MNNTHSIKKIGFYDSGLGGLFVMSKLYKEFPNYDYVFLADEKNLPYGEKEYKDLYSLASKSISFLIEKEKCDIVVVACNTLSSTVFPELEKEFKEKFKDVLLIDVVSPTVDSLKIDSNYTVFGTPRTILSHVYKKEIQNIFKDKNVCEVETRELASLIEKKENVLSYLESIKKNVDVKSDVCILGCTHYGLVLDDFKKVFPQFKEFVIQDTVVLDLFRFMLHKEDRIGEVVIYTTKKTEVFDEFSKSWFSMESEEVEI